MNATLEHALNTALIFGARLYGDHSSWSNGADVYYWQFNSPLTCTTHQVWMTSEEMLSHQRVRLYARHRDNFTGEITESGEFGGGELVYRIERNQPEETP